MASYAADKLSTSSSDQEKVHEQGAYSLDERRRAALAEVDSAKFSYVFKFK